MSPAQLGLFFRLLHFGISSLTNPKPNAVLQSDSYQASSPSHCRQHFPLSESSSSLSTSISNWSTPNEDEDRLAGEDRPELEREEHHIVIVQPQGEALERQTGGPVSYRQSTLNPTLHLILSLQARTRRKAALLMIQKPLCLSHRLGPQA